MLVEMPPVTALIIPNLERFNQICMNIAHCMYECVCVRVRVYMVQCICVTRVNNRKGNSIDY